MSGPPGPKGRPNRLASEKSPYLLQHAMNPVDWHPWGDEAFARARAEDRPIFLSIGYVTCHWCHVMERESFEDSGVAALLNRDFVSIKLDREERPDIDGIYMTVCQLMTGQGGWPLTIVMTPDKQPFFAGTYFPRESVPGRLGMLELLPRLAALWKDRRVDAETAGARALQAVREIETRHFGSGLTDGGAEARGGTEIDGGTAADGGAGGAGADGGAGARGGAGADGDAKPDGGGVAADGGAWARTEADGGVRGPVLDEGALRRGFDELRARFDRHMGGFGRAPKFPAPHQLLFLLRWSHRTGDERGVEMVEKTLASMRRGGIFDQLGFGFHRYSTDARWLVPHFEKMLYDQALLTMAYTELWQVTGRAEHRRVAEEVMAYVTRDLTDPGGAFHSAEDADSEGREGAFYLWTRDELDEALGRALGEEEARLARHAFGIERRGNFADEASGLRTGENILHLPGTPEELSALAGDDPGRLERRLAEIRRVLLERRATRERPLLDDKILTDWNGLMIAAMAQAGAAFGDEAPVRAAGRAAAFLLEHMRDERGRLLHRYRDGEAGLVAGAADHACLTWGLIELYGATFDVAWLEAASELLRELMDRFWDAEAGGVFNVDAEQRDVPVRQKELHDGATPSANAATWHVLVRMGRLTGDPELLQRAETLRRVLAGPVATAPSAHTMSLVALDLTLGPAHEVVVAGDPAAAGTGQLLDALASRYAPRTSVIFKPAGIEAASASNGAAVPGHETAARLEAVAPFTRNYGPVEGRAAAYVCSNFACRRPTTDAAEMLRQLEQPEASNPT